MRVRFYKTSSGRSPVEEFIREMAQPLKGDFFDAVALLDDGVSLDMPLSRNLSSIHKGLHELRLHDRTGQVRIFYYIKKGDAIYMLHALHKKTRVISDKDRKLILRRIKEV